jgi:hypothetical protein
MADSGATRTSPTSSGRKSAVPRPPRRSLASKCESARQQNSAEPLQNLRNGETENDGNKNREITKLVHAPNCRASVSDAKLIKRRFKDSRQQRQNDMNGQSEECYVQRHGFYVIYSFARTISQKRMTVRNGNSSQASTDGMHQTRNSQTSVARADGSGARNPS